MNRTHGKINDLAAVVDRITQQKSLDQVGAHADDLAQAKTAASRTIDDTWVMYDRGRRLGAHEVIREALEFAKILRAKKLDNEAAALCLFAKEQFEALEGK
jgi:hypothetical protein